MHTERNKKQRRRHSMYVEVRGQYADRSQYLFLFNMLILGIGVKSSDWQ